MAEKASLERIRAGENQLRFDRFGPDKAFALALGARSHASAADHLWHGGS